MAIRNPQYRNMWIWAGISLLGLAGILLPFGLDMGMNGPPLCFLGIFVSLLGLACVAVFRYRARCLEQLLTGQAVLAHWQYPPAQWADYLAGEFASEKGEKLALWGVISAIALIIGIGFWIADPEAGKWVFAVMLGLSGLMAVFAVLMPRLRYRRLQKGPHEVYISQYAAWLNGELHTWYLFGSQPRGMRLQKRKKGGCRVEIHYSYASQAGSHPVKLSVPVPAGAEQNARELVKRFNSLIA